MVLRRIVYVVIGLVSVGLAVVGALLPGMPSTVFVLIALWAFSHSSARLHRWVRRAPIFRDAMVHVDRYHHERSITRRVKIIAVSCAWTSVAAFVLVRGFTPSATAVVLVLLAIACTVFMALTRTARTTSPASS